MLLVLVKGMLLHVDSAVDGHGMQGATWTMHIKSCAWRDMGDVLVQT
jgi:hypothetical protein